MTQLGQGYDSFCREKCDYCNGLIEPLNPRVICGTGSSLVVVYHNVCWERLLERDFKKETLPGARELPGRVIPKKNN